MKKEIMDGSIRKWIMPYWFKVYVPMERSTDNLIQLILILNSKMVIGNGYNSVPWNL